MLVVLDLIIRPAADGVAKIDKILQQQRDRVGLGLRRECGDDFAGEAVISGGAQRRPVVVAGRARRCRRLWCSRGVPALFPVAVFRVSWPLAFAVVSLVSPVSPAFVAGIGFELFRGESAHDARSRRSRTMSLKSVPGRSGVSRTPLRPACCQRRLHSSAAACPVPRDRCRRAGSGARRRR